jgi:arylsulfatase
MENMSRREFVSAALVTTAFDPALRPAARPNVLLIMTDQHRADALGASGNQAIRTPHLDSLAVGGVLLGNCWTQHPVCMPSRASLFTGRYPGAHRVRTNGVPLPSQEKTLAQLFVDHGYRTGGAGKFHFLPHLNRTLPTMATHHTPFYGFEEFHIGEDGRTGEYGDWLKRHFPECVRKRDDEIPVEAHNTHWTATHTIDFIRRCAQSGQPFFAFCSFVDPHHGYNPPPPYRDMYKEADMPLPVRKEGELDDKPPFFRNEVKYYREKNKRVAYNRTQYYGEITLIDDHIGKILGVLDELKVSQDTLIVFTSDHGDLLGDHWLFTKGPFHYRSCANVPLLFHWPGCVKTAKVVDGLVQTVDIFPTIASLVGIPTPPGIQGRSQAGVLTTEATDTGYESIFIDYGTSGVTAPGVERPSNGFPDLYTIRNAQWRLSYYPGKPYGELYDLERDPEEFVNRWTDPKYNGVKTKM